MAYLSATKLSNISALNPGRGRGGILEHLMKTGVKPGVPQGRGIAPPDWGKFSTGLAALVRLLYMLPAAIEHGLFSKTCVKRPLSKRLKIGFQDQLSLNEGQKYCRMLQGEGSIQAPLQI